jgi:hypothetical protein
MRRPFAATFACSLLVAAGASAQPAPPPACDFGGARAPGQADIALPEPGFGNLFVLSPPTNAQVPRNVEIRLGGDVASLDLEPPIFTVELRDLAGARQALVREGGRLTPARPLAPRETFLIRIEATAAHPCPECVGQQELAITTTDEIDTTPPVLTGTPPVNVFVMPSPEEAAQCGFFFGTTHQIVVDFGGALPTNTWIALAARKSGESPRSLVEIFNTGAPFPVVGNVGTQVPVALGDTFYIAITPRDLAGNAGPSRTVRVRARSFTDQSLPRESLAPLWCDMPTSPTVRAPARLPTNGQLVVEFPFEEIPLALAPVGGAADERIPLIPLEDTALGHVYGTALPLPAGAEFDVVSLDCPRCICEGCARMEPQRITVGEGPDQAPPAAPVFVGLLEDASPTLSVEESCRPDRPAILVVLEPGEDDVTEPLALRYDATIRLDGGPPRTFATAAVPFARADGKVALRLESDGFGRVLSDPFELTLTAIDAAGHRSAGAALSHDPDARDGGCAGAGAGSWAALAALGVLRRRRRR